MAVFKYRDLAIGVPQVVVVEDPDTGEFADGRLEVRQGPWVAGDEFVRWHVVTTLGDAHRHALLRDLRTGNANEAQDYRVSPSRRVFQERQLVAHRIGKDGLKHETLPLIHQCASQGSGHPRGDVNSYSNKSYLIHGWHHMTAVRLDEALQIFIDGELAGQSHSNQPLDDQNYDLLLGRMHPLEHDHDARQWSGALDEIAIYDRALSAGEVMRHYRAAERIQLK